MVLPDRVFVIGVPYSWYQNVKAQYIVSGSSSLNCWGIKKRGKSAAAHPDPGSLILFKVDRDGAPYICGGGFFQSDEHLTPERAWKIFGVNNGASCYEDFLAGLKGMGYRSGEIVAHMVVGDFVFSRQTCYRLPEAIELGDLKDGELVSFGLDTPEGRYLAKYIMHERSSHLREGFANYGWPGIYRMASERNSRDYTMVFYARMMAAYDRRCAVTGDRTLPVLDVAHIRTFYDERFQRPDNGIVLRGDIHRLFSLGYITATYVSDTEARVRVSATLSEVGGAEYLKYDGSPLYLPEDPALRPSREYLEWHAERRFENWLKFGAVKPVALKPQKQDKS